MSVSRLDVLLREREMEQDLSSLLAQIAAENLWPGLRRPADLPNYLQSISGDSADLVTASLLILLQQDDSVLDDVSWRPAAGALLSKNLGRLAPHVQKPREKGAHAVFTACAGAVSAVEADLRAEVRKFSDVGRAQALQNGVLRRLNSGAGSLVLRPFIPGGDSDRDLKNLLSAVATLALGDTTAGDGPFVELQAAAARCKATADEIGTSFARMVLAETAESVLRVATLRNELSKPPATLAISASTRPLPLREPGVTCEVGFELKNSSEVRATDIRLGFRSESDSVVLGEESIELESLEGGSAISLSTALSILRPSDGLEIEITVAWRNPDHSAGASRPTVVLTAQDADVDWEAASVQKPFAPYPVEEARQLVGRGQLLRQLSLRFQQLPLSNIYVTGQRRVGKTSLVRVLAHELESQDDRLIVISVEMGEVRRDDGRETIGELGRALARKLVLRTGTSGAVDIPVFDATLAPLNALVDDLRTLDPRLKFVFAVDEFDELPDDMFERGGPGDAIFLPIRSLAQKPFVGWILVGGERMPFIRDEQAARLNTFNAVRVDYLEYVEHGASTDSVGSFRSLVQDPLPPKFKVSTDGVARIHAVTLGNPHFAKELCAVMYEDAVQRKDPLLERRDVERAVTKLSSRSDFELFAHFWEDGIFSNRAEDRRRTELDRRHYLVALAECLRVGRSTVSAVDQAAVVQGLDLSAAKRVRLDLIGRGVLENDGGRLTARVPIFGSWLEDEGVYKLPPRGISERADIAFKTADLAAAVSPNEVKLLLARWKSFRFRGESIAHEQIVAWLGQFANDTERRFMFRLLERFVPLTEAELVAGLRQLHRLVRRPGTVGLDRGQRTFNHVLVAGVGEAGSSGQMIAYKYRQANNIRQRNLVGIDELKTRAEDDAIQAVVLVDDVFGTGRTVAKSLEAIGNDGWPDVDTYAFAVTGVPASLKRIEGSPGARKMRLTVEVANPLLDQHRPFVAGSPVFVDDDAQQMARDIVERYGKRLAPSMPLGYKDQAILMTLPDNCPNNVPPIFWSDADGWVPLFPRTPR